MLLVALWNNILKVISMSRIAVIAYETTHAVNSSMMMHVNMMASCDHDITLVVSNKVDSDFFEGYNYKINT